ncbi:MAG: hypothetical protein HQ577_02990 [Dehalococcoidia bacterium]|nr:hypothetical protein [Dehalococcoidia bacterium]
MAVTSWYYDFYEAGAFPHQGQLCKTLEWTCCNLEGRRVIPTTLIEKLPDGTEKRIKTNSLTGETANPLTLRLLAFREALSQLEVNVNPIKEAIKIQSEKKFNKGKIFEVSGTYHAQDSYLKTGGAPIELIEISGKRKPIAFHYDCAYLALYSFFTNLGSVLDRLTYEIDMLYSLKITRSERYWSTLIKDTKPYLGKLKVKDGNLADLLVDYAGKFSSAIRYRNRMVHDGVIRLSLSSPYLKFDLMLAQDPNDDVSPMNVNAIEFCKEVKYNLLKLADKSYKLMLKRLQSHGNPPW